MNEDRDIYLGYSSLADMVNHAVNDKSEMPDSDRHSRTNSGPWSGGTWADSVSMAQNGDLVGARRLAPEVIKAVNATLAHCPRLDPVYRLDEGRWIDVARFVKGEPECWGDMVESEPMPRRGISLVINMSVPSGVNAGRLDRAGIVIGGLVLGLQAQGIPVTLYTAIRAGGYGKYDSSITYAPVNPGGGILDISRLSIVLRPWFLRRIWFSLVETLDADYRRSFGVGSGYGKPSYLRECDLRKITGTKDAIAVEMGEVCDRPESIKNEVLNRIKGGN